mmetsp:Transcript_302/g.852  ORF Transcript_302/g.852 Transcript_302/m.852 type:complete len:87 (+) Transcript_302:1663-1923(+)
MKFVCGKERKSLQKIEHWTFTRCVVSFVYLGLVQLGVAPADWCIEAKNESFGRLCYSCMVIQIFKHFISSRRSLGEQRWVELRGHI